MKNSLTFLLFIILTACSQFTPFEDMRREAGHVQPVGQSSNTSPIICYNPLWHDLKETEDLADTACARTNKKAIYLESKHFNCRLFNPSSAIYRCQ